MPFSVDLAFSNEAACSRRANKLNIVAGGIGKNIPRRIISRTDMLHFRSVPCSYNNSNFRPDSDENGLPATLAARAETEIENQYENIGNCLSGRQ
jgi:hypothetical protein